MIQAQTVLRFYLSAIATYYNDMAIDLSIYRLRLEKLCGRKVNGGATMQFHADDPLIIEMNSSNWDYVVLQASQEPSFHFQVNTQTFICSAISGCVPLAVVHEPCFL